MHAGVLIAGRAVQGVGAALLLPGTLAVVTIAFPDAAERARAIRLWVSVGSLALLAGPVVGGALVAAAGWRAVFLPNVPLVAIALTLGFRVLPRTRGNRGRRPD